MVEGMIDPRDEAIEGSLAREREAADFRKLVAVRAELAFMKRERTKLLNEVATAEERLSLALALDRPIRCPKVSPKAAAHRGAFVLLCSDWHVGERVDPEQVGGRNQYTPDIAGKRLAQLIEGALWMIEAWRSGKDGYGWMLDQAVIWLGGDLMTGMIHEDLAESNYLSPTEEVLLAQEMAVRVIEAVAKHAGIERVFVPCSFGNHGRDTPDRRVSTGWKRSYEWLMYQQIAKRYNGSENVVVHAGKDEITRLNLLGKRLRFTHGDQLRYSDGIGGLTIPARKWLAKLDRTEPADVTCIGHWHQYMDIGDLVVNNCLIGWGAYAQRVAPYSPASQVCFLLDERYGKRMSTEIICQ